MRTDKARNIAKVAKVALKEPLLTRDEIAEKAGVGAGTASRALAELDETGRKNEDIIKITDKDKIAIELAQRIIIQSLEKHVELSEASGGLDLQEALKASGLAKESTARYSLFRGSATDNEGGLKGISNIEIT